MANILIAGYGYVGSALADELMRDNHQVWAICRSAKQVNFTLIQKDLFSLNAQDIPQDIDYVFYMLSAGERSIDAYQKAYPQGLRQLLGCLDLTNIKRLFYISSTGVYANSDQWQDESAQIKPNNEFSKVLLEAEQVALAAAVPATVIRFGGLYGPGRTSLIDKVKQGQATLSEQDHYTNRIHRVDAARVCVHLMNMTAPESCYNGVDCACVPYNEVVQYLAKQLGVAPPTERAPLSRPSKKISNRKLLSTGFSFKYPSYKEGYLSLLQD